MSHAWTTKLEYVEEFAEQVIGTLLMWPNTVDRVLQQGLEGEHFRAPNLRGLYEAIVALHDEQTGIDPLTVAERAGQDYVFVDALTAHSETLTLDNAVAKIMEGALWRRRWHAAHEIVIAAESWNENVYAAAESKLNTGHRKDETTYVPDELADLVWTGLEAPQETFQWPFQRLDELTMGGMRRGEVTLLGGWTSHGKSVLLDQILKLSALRGLNTHLFINEMTPRQRTARFVASDSMVPMGDIVRGSLDADQTKRVMQSLGRIPFAITDCAGWNVQQICRAIRRMRPDVVGIDILHLIEHRDERDLAAISSAINACSKRAECHIVATVHLNENRVVGQTRPLPTLGDIRGSGMLKNDADNVLFVFREQDADTGYPQRKATAYLPKVRSGIPGGVELDFNGARMQFEIPERWRTAA